MHYPTNQTNNGGSRQRVFQTEAPLSKVGRLESRRSKMKQKITAAMVSRPELDEAIWPLPPCFLAWFLCVSTQAWCFQ